MYTVIRVDGKVCGIRCGLMDIPLDPQNSDYQRFLEWHAHEPVKLDLSDHAPPVQEPDPDKLRKDELKEAVKARPLTSDEINEVVRLLLLRPNL